MLSAELLAILRCPKCRGQLSEQTSEQTSGKADPSSALVCPVCRLRYAIADGIPNLIIDEAQPLSAGQ